MKKLFLILVMMSFIVSFSAMVMAETLPTTTDVTSTVTFAVTPTTLTFGEIATGQTKEATNNPISIDPTGSNVDVTVAISGTSGDSLFSNIGLKTLEAADWTSVNSYPSFIISCAGNPCTYTPAQLNARLFVPSGTTKGLKSGAITYTITEAIPLLTG